VSMWYTEKSGLLVGGLVYNGLLVVGLLVDSDFDSLCVGSTTNVMVVEMVVLIITLSVSLYMEPGCRRNQPALCCREWADSELS
jgi:hypothetical protein